MKKQGSVTNYKFELIDSSILSLLVATIVLNELNWTSALDEVFKKKSRRRSFIIVAGVWQCHRPGPDIIQVST